MDEKPEKGSPSVLSFPRHHFRPEPMLHFIELKPFTRRWQDLKLDDDALRYLQVAISAQPRAYPLMRGTGGLRKLRYAPPDWPQGKRGALRICYVYFDEFKTVLLAIVYGKNEKADLTAAERSGIKSIIETIEAEFARRRLKYKPEPVVSGNYKIRRVYS